MWKFGRQKPNLLGNVCYFSSCSVTGCDWIHPCHGSTLLVDVDGLIWVDWVDSYRNNTQEKSWNSCNFMSTSQSVQLVHCIFIYSDLKYDPTNWGEFVLQFFQMVGNGPLRWVLNPDEVTSRHLQLFCNHQCHCWQPPDKWLAACSGYLRRDAAKQLGVTPTAPPKRYNHCFLKIGGSGYHKHMENCPILPTWQVPTSTIMFRFGTSRICSLQCKTWGREMPKA